MSNTQSRTPEWREHPSAVSEAVFYVTSPESDAGPDGKYRFGFRPMSETDPANRSVYAKGDFIPDFDYASAFGEVFRELAFALQDHIQLNNFEDGDVVLRFVAFKRLDEWSMTGPDSVVSTLESLPLNTVGFDSESNTGGGTGNSKTPMDVDEREREVMLGELAAIYQLQGDVSPELIREHSPRDVGEYRAAFGSLTDAINTWEEQYGESNEY